MLLFVTAVIGQSEEDDFRDKVHFVFAALSMIVGVLEAERMKSGLAPVL